MGIEAAECQKLLHDEKTNKRKYFFEQSYLVCKEAKKKFINGRNIFIICLNGVNQGIGYTVMASFFPVVATSEKDVTIADVGIIMSTLSMTAIVVGFFSNKLLQMMGSKKLLLFSILCEFISVLLLSLVMYFPTKISFYIACVLFKVIQGTGFVTDQVASLAIAAEDYKGVMSTATGLIEMSFGFGIALGPAVGGTLFYAAGFGFPFYYLAVQSLVLFVLTYAFVHTKSSSTDPQKTENIDETTLTDELVLNMKTVFKVPGVLLVAIQGLIPFMFTTYFGIAFSPFLSKTFGSSSATIGLIYFGSSLIYCCSAPGIGYFVDKFGYKELTIVIGCIVSILAFLLVGPVPFFNMEHKLWLTGFSLALVYAANGLMYIPVPGLCVDILHESHFTVNEHTMGFLSSLIAVNLNIGDFLGFFVGGIILKTFGFEWSGLVLAITILVLVRVL